MATFNSVLIGKAKGKVGNVVLTSIKGQNIVKSLNDKPANPRSVGQTDNRVQMSNAVLAWQFLALFLANAKGLTKSTESVYNAFVRVIKSGMATTLYETRVEAANAALNLQLFFGNWFSISMLSVVADAVVCTINTNGIQWVNTMQYCYVEYDTLGAPFKVLTAPLTEADFNAGSFEIAAANIDMDNKYIYIYDTASNKITNIL